MDTSFFKSYNNHKVYLDVLRILCIFLVVYNHTAAFHVPLRHPVGDNFVLLLVSICDKVAVPIFFMISGALLLKKSESITQLLKKRIFRFVLVIALFALIQYIYLCWTKNLHPTFIGYISACVNPGKVYLGVTQDGIRVTALSASVSWYLYAYLGLLLMLPMLRSMVQSLENSVYIYMAFLYILIEVIFPSFIYLCGGYNSPNITLANYIPLISSSYIKGCAYSVSFFIFGYYLEEKVDVRRLSAKFFCFTGVIALLFIVLDAFLTRHAGRHISNLNAGSIQYLPWFNASVFPACVFIYLLTKKVIICFPPSNFFKWGVAKLGGAVFTVFFFENIFRGFYYRMFSEYKSTYPVCVTLLAVCLTVVSGLILGLVFKKTPGLKKIL